MKLSIVIAWSIERNHPKNLEFPDKYPIKGFFVKNSNEGRREISAEQNTPLPNHFLKIEKTTLRKV